MTHATDHPDINSGFAASRKVGHVDAPDPTSLTTLSLRASQDHAAWLAVVVVGYVVAFALLTLVLRAGVAIGVAYGIWGAIGTAVTAVLGAVIFDDPFTWAVAAGIGLIIAGVLLIEFGSHSDAQVQRP